MLEIMPNLISCDRSTVEARRLCGRQKRDNDGQRHPGPGQPRIGPVVCVPWCAAWLEGATAGDLASGKSPVLPSGAGRGGVHERHVAVALGIFILLR